MVGQRVYQPRHDPWHFHTFPPQPSHLRQIKLISFPNISHWFDTIVLWFIWQQHYPTTCSRSHLITLWGIELAERFLCKCPAGSTILTRNSCQTNSGDRKQPTCNFYSSLAHFGLSHTFLAFVSHQGKHDVLCLFCYLNMSYVFSGRASAMLGFDLVFSGDQKFCCNLWFLLLGLLWDGF